MTRACEASLTEAYRGLEVLSDLLASYRKLSEKLEAKFKALALRVLAAGIPSMLSMGVLSALMAPHTLLVAPIAAACIASLYTMFKRDSNVARHSTLLSLLYVSTLSLVSSLLPGG